MIRPSLPVPEIEAGSSLDSARIFRTAGDKGISSLGESTISPFSSATTGFVSSVGVVMTSGSGSGAPGSTSVSASSFCSGFEEVG